mgnify:CR=1 FL=1
MITYQGAICALRAAEIAGLCAEVKDLHARGLLSAEEAHRTLDMTWAPAGFSRRVKPAAEDPIDAATATVHVEEDAVEQARRMSP